MDSIDTGASDGAPKAPCKRRVLADPLYTMMIRQALYSTDETCQANEFRSQEGRGCEEIESKLESSHCKEMLLRLRKKDVMMVKMRLSAMH
ncbi:unnamed protein product [Brassica rapa]|uniref:Uncharacterized protein n=1 Tax=Brassica campestris TaxID=3711 RepID=A0A8D9DIB1_BRACM|nr:unnamed protein product [Brassica rapa]